LQILANRQATQGGEGAAQHAGFAGTPFACDTNGEGWADFQRHPRQRVTRSTHAQVIAQHPLIVDIARFNHVINS